MWLIKKSTLCCFPRSAFVSLSQIISSSHSSSQMLSLKYYIRPPPLTFLQLIFKPRVDLVTMQTSKNCIPDLQANEDNLSRLSNLYIFRTYIYTCLFCSKSIHLSRPFIYRAAVKRPVPFLQRNWGIRTCWIIYVSVYTFKCWLFTYYWQIEHRKGNDHS